jgi:hypothetical protein
MLVKSYNIRNVITDKQGRQCTKKRNTEARSNNHFCLGKAIIISYSEYVPLTLVIQRGKRMRRIILSSMACSSLLF